MSLRFAALGMLCQESGSGYDLMQRFTTSLINVWSASQGQLYTELNRLAADGLIDVSTTGSRGRKVYSANDSGRAALREWMARPVSDPVRNAQLLKVYLMTEVDSDAARTFFEEHLAHAEAEVAHRREIGANPNPNPTQADEFASVVVDFGLRYAELNRDWARDTLRRLP